MLDLINEQITRDEVEKYLRAKGYTPFYNDNYWVPPGGSDYSGKTLCESYCRAKFPTIPLTQLFDLVVHLEFLLNRNRRLYIHGKTYQSKEDLKSKFNAKWDAEKKKWFVAADLIKNHEFHDFCYHPDRRFTFQWQ